MINTIFFGMALFPILLGLAFILKPRKMKKIQAWFRKKLERFEMAVFKAHKKVGVCFVLVGVVMVYTYFQPVWIYNMFLIARVVMGMVFPEMMDQVQQVEATPMVCI
jgi:hypothetical protein